VGEERYIYSAEKDEVELSRLTLQESVIDPPTIRHLEALGVGEGWKCLEVGAGAGSIAQWLLKRVGPAGKVVATDIDTKFLSRLSAPNLEVRRHDILKDALEVDEYDLAHCRYLLHHLPEPEKALKRMADAVRPGGWLLIEEDDYGSMLSTDITDPSAAPFTAALRAMFDLARKKGIVDQYWGRRVRGLVEQLGYVDVGHEGWTLIVRGGDPLARVWAAPLPTFLAMELLTQEQHDALQRLLEPSFYCLGHTIFSAWGRKPVQEGRI
jgi:SAM-dependent methyltransferase